MAEDGLDPNLIIYNVTLAVCVRNGAMSDVTHLYAEMKEKGVAADLVTFGTLMAACAKHSNLSTAESLLMVSFCRLFFLRISV
jgi:pentatricopeptide repeat protein